MVTRSILLLSPSAGSRLLMASGAVSVYAGLLLAPADFARSRQRDEDGGRDLFLSRCRRHDCVQLASRACGGEEQPSSDI